MATYATAADLAAWVGVDPADEAQLTLAVGAASSAIDRACNREFGLAATPSARWFTAEWDRDQWIIPIDDVMTTAGLVIELDNDRDGIAEAVVTSYRLGPVNAAAKGQPFTRIEILPNGAVKPNGLRHGVAVTAIWGWTEVPDAIRYATLVQAARFYDRRENVGGPLASKRVDDVSYAWRASDLDEDVATAVAPYWRVWAAV